MRRTPHKLTERGNEHLRRLQSVLRDEHGKPWPLAKISEAALAYLRAALTDERIPITGGMGEVLKDREKARFGAYMEQAGSARSPESVEAAFTEFLETEGFRAVVDRLAHEKVQLAVPHHVAVELERLGVPATVNEKGILEVGEPPPPPREIEA